MPGGEQLRGWAHIVSHLLLYVPDTEGTANPPKTWGVLQGGLGSHAQPSCGVVVSGCCECCRIPKTHLGDQWEQSPPPCSPKAPHKPHSWRQKERRILSTFRHDKHRRKTLQRIVVEYIWIANTFEEIPVCLGTEERKINSSHYSLEIICSAPLLNVSAKDDFQEWRFSFLAWNDSKRNEYSSHQVRLIYEFHRHLLTTAVPCRVMALEVHSGSARGETKVDVPE